MNRIAVYSTFDNNHQTWNVMDLANHCLFFGNIESLETWLDEHKDKYREEIEQ